MADTYIFALSNNKSKGIVFYNADGFSENLTINSISFNMPGQTDSENISLNLGGFTKLISLNFILRADGVDRSCTISKSGNNYTFTATTNSIISLKQQWEWIMGDGTSSNYGIVQDKGTSDTTTDLIYYLRTWFKDYNGTIVYKYYTGTLEDITIEPVNGEPILRGRLTLKTGSNPLTLTEE